MTPETALSSTWTPTNRKKPILDSQRVTLDFHKLRHALAVARAGSFSAAAEAIHISQSALTRSVQLLEEAYDIRLFERGKFGATLTLEGARFVALAEEAMVRAQSTHESLQMVATHQPPPVCFGMGSLTAACFLPLLLPALARRATRYRIVIESNTIMQLMLRQGDIDFYVGGVRRGTDLQTSAHKLAIQTVGGGSVGVLVREGHPILETPLTRETLLLYPTAAGSFVRETLGTDWLEQRGLRSPSIELDEYSLLLSVARNTDYLVIASAMLLANPDNSGLCLLFSISVSDQIDWAVVRSAGREISLAARQTADLTLTVMSDALKTKAQPYSSSDAGFSHRAGQDAI